MFDGMRFEINNLITLEDGVLACRCGSHWLHCVAVRLMHPRQAEPELLLRAPNLKPSQNPSAMDRISEYRYGWDVRREEGEFALELVVQCECCHEQHSWTVWHRKGSILAQVEVTNAGPVYG